MSSTSQSFFLSFFLCFFCREQNVREFVLLVVLDTFQGKHVSSFARKFKLEEGRKGEVGGASVVFLPRFAALKSDYGSPRVNVIRRRVSLLGRLLEIHGNANSDAKSSNVGAFLFFSAIVRVSCQFCPGGSHQNRCLSS